MRASLGGEAKPWTSNSWILTATPLSSLVSKTQKVSTTVSLWRVRRAGIGMFASSTLPENSPRRLPATERDVLMARQLKTIANWINTHVPDLRAHIERGYCNTDRKIRHGRIRIPGKGRIGNRIVVTRKQDNVIVLDHNAAETYRCNADVERWLATWLAGGTSIPPRGKHAW